MSTPRTGRRRTRTQHETRPDRPRMRVLDRGESLVEIVLTIMIIGITVTALVSGLATVANAGNAHRVGVEADTVLRNAAEAVKSAVRTCTAGDRWTPVIVTPDRYTVELSPDDTSCPNVKEARRIEISVVAPDGVRHATTIVVRTP